MQLAEIQKFSNRELVGQLHELFEKERKLSHTILLYLKVIQERRLFAQRGYPNLFEMLMKEFKLSETSAYQRIKALELLMAVPQAEESFIKGEVNLTTLAMAQRQMKREEKLSNQKISTQRKCEIFESIRNKTQAQTEVELMRLLPATASSPPTVEKRISEDSVRISLNVPDRVKDKLKRLQEIWAHVNPSMEYIEIIERALDETLSRVDPELRAIRKTAQMKSGTPAESGPRIEAGDLSLSSEPKTGESKESREMSEGSGSKDAVGTKKRGEIKKTSEVTKTNEATKTSETPETNKSNLKPITDDLPSLDYPKALEVVEKFRRSVVQDVASGAFLKTRKYFSAETRRIVYERAHHCCEYQDELTQRKCPSKFALEIDHVVPIACGGTNEISNLRLLCNTHNLLMALKWFQPEDLEVT